MTTEEFSLEFDVLVNAYFETQPFGAEGDVFEFNEYEKSVFLTDAQEKYVLNYYSTSTAGDSFETSEEVRRYLDGLVKTGYPTRTNAVSYLSDLASFKHSIFSLPPDTWFIVYEQATFSDGGPCNAGKVVLVIPTTHDSYSKTKGNPFRGPSSRRVLRLDSGDSTVELISKYNIGSYEIRYVKRPAPIILADLDGLKIKGLDTIQTCELNTNTHRKILELAVQLAIASRASQRQTN